MRYRKNNRWKYVMDWYQSRNRKYNDYMNNYENRRQKWNNGDNMIITNDNNRMMNVRMINILKKQEY